MKQEIESRAARLAWAHLNFLQPLISTRLQPGEQETDCDPQPLQRFPTRSKPLKRLNGPHALNTRLKPGANEIRNKHWKKVKCARCPGALSFLGAGETHCPTLTGLRPANPAL